MQTHSAIWGHVALTTPATASMQKSEEDCMMTMLRCRYGKTRAASVSLTGFLPRTEEVIFNPNTLQDLANIFEISIEKAFV